VPALGVAVGDVIGLRSFKKVRWPHAGRNITPMQDIQARHAAMLHRERDPVR